MSRGGKRRALPSSEVILRWRILFAHHLPVRQSRDRRVSEYSAVRGGTRRDLGAVRNQYAVAVRSRLRDTPFLLCCCCKLTPPLYASPDTSDQQKDMTRRRSAPSCSILRRGSSSCGEREIRRRNRHSVTASSGSTLRRRKQTKAKMISVMSRTGEYK